MHYYRFHVGDYLSATSHLTDTEDLCYRRLLDMYYTTEAGIPTDLDRVARRVRMPRETVEVVLRDFFKETSDGWIQDRCEQEIAGYHDLAEIARENGKRGGRPKKPSGFPAGSQRDAAGYPAGTEQEPNGNPTGTQQEPAGNPTATQTKANQEPITSNQEPVTNNEEVETPATDARMCPPDWQPSRELAAYACGVLKELALNKEILHFRAYKWRRPVQDWDDAWRRWVQQAAKSGSYAKQEWH